MQLALNVKASSVLKCFSIHSKPKYNQSIRYKACMLVSSVCAYMPLYYSFKPTVKNLTHIYIHTHINTVLRLMHVYDDKKNNISYVSTDL